MDNKPTVNGATSWLLAAWAKEGGQGLCAFGLRVQGRVQPFCLTAPLLGVNTKWVPAQEVPEMVEAGRGRLHKRGRRLEVPKAQEQRSSSPAQSTFRAALAERT